MKYGWMWEKITMSQGSDSNFGDLFRFRRSLRNQGRPERSPRRRRPRPRGPHGGRSVQTSVQSTDRTSIEYFKWFPGRADL